MLRTRAPAGHIAVQWAKLKGCRVAGTCGDASKAAMLKELGCDVVVRRRPRLLTVSCQCISLRPYR